MSEILLNKELFEQMNGRFESVFTSAVEGSSYANKAERAQSRYQILTADMSTILLNRESDNIRQVMRNIIASFSETDNELSEKAKQIGEQYVGPGISSAIQNWINVVGKPGFDPATIADIISESEEAGGLSSSVGLASFTEKVTKLISEEDIGKGTVKLLKDVSGTEVSPVIGSAITGLIITLKEKSTYGDMKLGIQESEDILVREYIDCENNGNWGGQIFYGGILYSQRVSYNIVNTATNAAGSFVSGLGSPFKLAGKAADYVLGKDNVVTKGIKGIGKDLSKVGSWLKNLM